MEKIQELFKILERLESAETDEEREAIMNEVMDLTPLEKMFTPIWGMIMETVVKTNAPKLAVAMVEILIPFTEEAAKHIPVEAQRLLKSKIAKTVMMLENSHMEIIHASSTEINPEGKMGGMGMRSMMEEMLKKKQTH